MSKGWKAGGIIVLLLILIGIYLLSFPAIFFRLAMGNVLASEYVDKVPVVVHDFQLSVTKGNVDYEGIKFVLPETLVLQRETSLLRSYKSADGTQGLIISKAADLKKELGLDADEFTEEQRKTYNEWVMGSATNLDIYRSMIYANRNSLGWFKGREELMLSSVQLILKSILTIGVPAKEYRFGNINIFEFNHIDSNEPTMLTAFVDDKELIFNFSGLTRSQIDEIINSIVVLN